MEQNSIPKELQDIMAIHNISTIYELESKLEKLLDQITHIAYGYSRGEYEMRVMIDAFAYAFDMSFPFGPERQFTECNHPDRVEVICRGLQSIGIDPKAVCAYENYARRRDERNIKAWHVLNEKEAEYLESMKSEYAKGISESFESLIIRSMEFAFDPDKKYHEDIAGILGYVDATYMYAWEMECAKVPSRIIEEFKKLSKRFYNEE